MPEGRGLFEVARERMRTRHLALRTEQAYLQWMRRYVKFHNRRHPRDMGPAEVEAFLTHLAVDAKVGASTQNQALQALLFLYRQVLGIELPWLENVTRASRPKRLPVVLTAAEVRSVLSHLDGTSWLIANLLYGSGLRLMEAHRLRVKDLMIERGEVIARDAKGGKDRVTVLSASLAAARSRRCGNYDDLHSCDEKGGDGRKKPFGPAALSHVPKLRCAAGYSANPLLPLYYPWVPWDVFSSNFGGLNSAS
jgi:integrase